MNKEDLVLDEEKDQPEEEEKPIERLICPSCRLLYEKMTTCIRCGSALVKEIDSQQGEESEIPYILEAEKEEFQTASSSEVTSEKPIETFSPEVKKEPLKPVYPSKAKKESPHVQTSEKPLIGELSEDIMGEVSPSPPEKSKKKFLRLSFERISVFILIAVGIFFLWTIYSYFAPKRSGPSTPRSEETTGLTLPSPPPTINQTSTPVVPEVKEKEQQTQSSPMNELEEVEGIKDLLEKIRQANLQKNINLFMSCYSTDFRNREGKKRTTLESWSNFNYLDLSYTLNNYLISGHTAQAKVEWLIKFYLKEGSRTKENRSILDVTFSKEDGGWKIKEIKTAR